MALGWHAIVLDAFRTVATECFARHSPIPQPQKYHAFANDRAIWGIANFINVVSNVASLIPEVAGLWLYARLSLTGAHRA